MSDGVIKNTFLIGNDGALKAINDIQKEVVRLEKENAKLAQSSKKGASEYGQASREAKQLLASLVSETDRHNNKVAELKRLLDANKISQGQYTAAVTEANKQLAASEGHMSRTAGAGKAAFGSAAVSSLLQYVAGVGSVGTALQKAIELFQTLDQEAQKAFQRIQDSQAGMSELAGQAKDENEAKQLIHNARKAYDSGVGKSEDEAARLHYKLRATGLYGEREVFEALDRSNVIADVVGTAGATARIQSAMGKEETGDATAVTSKLFRASDATQYSFDQVAVAAAEPALFAGKLKMKDEELLAQLASGMQVLDPAKAGTGARSYYEALLKQGGFEGLSATEQMAKVRGTLAPMDEEARKKFFGSIEGQTFFEALQTKQGQETFQQQMVALPEAERTKLALRKAKFPDVDPALRRSRLAELAKRKREAQDRPEGTDRALSEAIIDEQTARTKESMGNMPAAVERVGLQTLRLGLGDQVMIDDASRDNALSQSLRDEIGAPRGKTLGQEVAATSGNAYGWFTHPERKTGEWLGQKVGNRIVEWAGLEAKTDRQTEVVSEGVSVNKEVVNEIRGLRQDIQRIQPVPVPAPVPPSRPLPRNTSLANQVR